jgi:hypothetical protein
MPQPRKYANRAQQQAAYRNRRAAAHRAQMQAKGLPALPPIAAIPGTVRWRGALRMAQELLELVCNEMDQYANDRSEEWQDSERAEEFADRLAGIEGVRDSLDDYL